MCVYHQKLIQMTMINQLDLLKQLTNTMLWTEKLNSLGGSFDVVQMNNFGSGSPSQFQQAVVQQSSQPNVTARLHAIRSPQLMYNSEDI